MWRFTKLNNGEFDHKKVVKVLKGKRITLPKDYLTKYNIKEGDLIAYVEDKNSKRMTLVPVIAVPRTIEHSGGKSN